MVVTVSVTFLVLTAPVGVDNAFYRLFMNLTQYLNHSINGILYCIVGSKFRNELLKIFGRKENFAAYPSSNTNSTNIS